MIGNKTSDYAKWLCRQPGVPRLPFEEAKKFLRSTDPKHDEKLRRIRLVLSVTKGQRYPEVSDELARRRAEIKGGLSRSFKKRGFDT